MKISGCLIPAVGRGKKKGHGIKAIIRVHSGDELLRKKTTSTKFT